MASVYNHDAFEDRVNYAAQCLVVGGSRLQTRHFDTCFEMNDGDYVAAALYRRGLKNPKLMQAIEKYMNMPKILQNHDDTKHLSRKQLAYAAKVFRDEQRAAFLAKYPRLSV